MEIHKLLALASFEMVLKIFIFIFIWFIVHHIQNITPVFKFSDYT